MIVMAGTEKDTLEAVNFSVKENSSHTVRSTEFFFRGGLPSQKWEVRLYGQFLWIVQ